MFLIRWKGATLSSLRGVYLQRKFPRAEFDWRGLDFPREQWDALNKFDPTEWQRELLWQDELLLKIHARLPKELIFQRELLISRL